MFLFYFRTAISELKNKTSPCGRFQFQCHSGDCIAVYNACDGIPQCDDGSDEGPEVWYHLIFAYKKNNKTFKLIDFVV